MNVSINRDFILSLESNPTTGYRWEATFSSLFLELKGKDFEPLNLDPSARAG